MAHQHRIANNDVGGVTDGSFRVAVRSKLGLDIAHHPASHVPGVLGEALDDLTLAQLVDRPTQGQPNSFRGILEWSHLKKLVTARCVYYSIRVVTRRISNQEMCRIFDYPTNRFSEMTEQETQLLTCNDIPGKVVLGAIHVLDEFEKPGETVLAPRGVAQVDITEGRGKRKGYKLDEKTRPWKRCCAEGEFLSMRED